MNVNEQVVETMLRARFGAEPSEPCQGLLRVSEALARPLDDAAVSAAAHHLAGCADCRETLLVYGSLQASTRHVPEAAPSAGDALKRWRRPVVAVWAGVAAVAAAVLVVSLNFVGSDTVLQVKGVDYGMNMAVQRGTERFTLQPGESVETGDHLGLFYSAPERTFLAVFSVDRDGKSSLLFPVGGQTSASVEPAVQSPLPDGAVVREGSACEWIVAVFSERPLAVSALGQALLGARRAPACTLDPTIPNARVVVAPVRQ